MCVYPRDLMPSPHPRALWELELLWPRSTRTFLHIHLCAKASPRALAGQHPADLAWCHHKPHHSTVFLLGDAAPTSLRQHLPSSQGCQRAKTPACESASSGIPSRALQSGEGSDLQPFCCSSPEPAPSQGGDRGFCIPAGSRAGRIQSIHTALLTASDKGGRELTQCRSSPIRKGRSWCFQNRLKIVLAL